jgi:ADP-ribosylglycohydrolase
MLPDPAILRHILRWQIRDARTQGHDTTGLDEQVEAAGASYDRLVAAAEAVANAPLRADWTWQEPDDWAGITAAWDATDLEPQPIAAAAARERIAAAFTASCCGCVLGKPLEVNPTLDELRAAAEPLGEWPLADYVSEALLERLGRRHGSWPGTVRGRIDAVERDDDLCYTLIGMLVLEAKGAAFTTEDVAQTWFDNLPAGWCFGPENQIMARLAGFMRYGPGLKLPMDIDGWRTRFLAGSELCGALIRADAYGYACPGDPRRAAEFAWRDARLTHRRTGAYATMFAAAAIAAAFTTRDPLDIFRRAVRVVPRRSRLREVLDRSLTMVTDATGWLEAYAALHGAFGAYGHCQVYQELGTVINTLRFAQDVGQGLGLQVGQGNDTDSFGCTAGSILGAYFGPGHLAAHWTAPFHDRVRTAVAAIGTAPLSGLCDRLAALPARCVAG